jgi:hypothetical protein
MPTKNKVHLADSAKFEDDSVSFPKNRPLKIRVREHRRLNSHRFMHITVVARFNFPTQVEIPNLLGKICVKDKIPVIIGC